MGIVIFLTVWLQDVKELEQLNSYKLHLCSQGLYTTLQWRSWDYA